MAFMLCQSPYSEVFRRKGMVVSVAEPDTLFVIRKMCKSLQMTIPKASVTEGALEIEQA